MTSLDHSIAPKAAPMRTNWFQANWCLILATTVLIAILVLPTPVGLPIAGQRMLAVFGFAVVLWMSEVVDYAVSAVLVTALIAFLLGTAPDPAKPQVLFGTTQGLTMALSGFANTVLALVAGALCLAAAMTITGLDRRIALFVLSRVGAKTSNVLAGIIIVATVLSFLVPSATARAACVVPIVMGVILAFGVDKKSRFAGLLMITAAQAVSIWNVGVKTASAQNMIAIGFIQKILGQSISWGEWLVAAAPFSIIMSIALYIVMVKMMPPETKEIAGGKDAIAKALADLGPMTGPEKKLLTLTLILLGFWASEQMLHFFDTSSTTVAAVALMFLPGIGIISWKQAQANIPWGTILLFAVGVSLGTALLQTQAAAWLANLMVVGFGLNTLAGFSFLAIMAGFLIVIHLGFASATALAAAMIPIIIAVLQKVETPTNIIGMTMLLQFVISFGYVLPVNSPQGMLAYGTQTFEARDFVRTGAVFTIFAYLLTLLFGATYWHWLGYV
jgi:solute carrier family 13 (sodium-dependent dicarboxylate transporter), member 2/3/5